ncbi:hypothetical protein AB5J72_24510 [Streptomyces sp. CG1]|uniref:hypothetical protein n=1 Tax=Streptomyces sp. CG1 TaxID=1287523 RepID=UPI0034E25815
MVAAVVLPLAVASAGQVGEAARQAMAERPRDAAGNSGHKQASGSGKGSGRDHAAGSHDDTATGDAAKAADAAGGGDAKIPDAGRTPGLLGLGLATAARCGPQLTSADGLEAQTCVLTEGADTWARTYYRNATGKSLDSVLSLMGPGGRSVQMHCVTGTDDEPATCETPREHTKGGPDGYTAVDEFATRGADGALLLRSGSDTANATNNGQPTGRS